MRTAIVTFFLGLLSGAAVWSACGDQAHVTDKKAGYSVGVGKKTGSNTTVDFVEACVETDGSARLVLRHRIDGQPLPDKGIAISATCQAKGRTVPSSWCRVNGQLFQETRNWLRACAASGECNL
jgi:hypothetical protein